MSLPLFVSTELSSVAFFQTNIPVKLTKWTQTWKTLVACFIHDRALCKSNVIKVYSEKVKQVIHCPEKNDAKRKYLEVGRMMTAMLIRCWKTKTCHCSSETSQKLAHPKPAELHFSQIKHVFSPCTCVRGDECFHIQRFLLSVNW